MLVAVTRNRIRVTRVKMYRHAIVYPDFLPRMVRAGLSKLMFFLTE